MPAAALVGVLRKELESRRIRGFIERDIP